MKRIIFILHIVLLFIGCKGLFDRKDDELSFVKTPNTSDKIRLDGYYYNYDFVSTHIVTYFFYRNGIVLFWGTTNSIEHFEEILNDEMVVNKIRAHKSSWGLYQLNNDTIITNGLFVYPGELRLISNISKGIILNDTTIMFNSSVKSNNSVRLRNDTLHFKQFSPKTRQYKCVYKIGWHIPDSFLSPSKLLN